MLGGGTAADDALLKSYGDEAVGMITCAAYTSDLDTPSNRRLVEGMVKDYGNIPGIYAAGLYINGMVAEAALEKTGGKTEDRDALIRALRAVSLTDTPRARSPSITWATSSATSTSVGPRRRATSSSTRRSRRTRR